VGILMQTLSFRRRQFLRALLSLGFGVESSLALAAGEPIAIVVSSNSRQRGLSSDKLRRIFLALPTDDDDGRRFVPVNLAQSSNVREHFDREVLNMSREEAARYWIDQRLRGNKPPRSASSLDICRRAVQELPGAISYLPLSGVGSLRILAIDGRAPSESNYALR
jgi:hypothetical protein